ncbi:MAG: primosomal protein N' [Arthrobacter sp.]|uniref:primosomal protein N' n=1 Tax=Arthrobacter sp. TaxID=1667 RepID=UPI0034737902
MEPRQPSLLQGFDVAKPLPGSPIPAAELPIARVLLETPVPHLDRYYDYLVPADLAADARVGARVKVRFGGQELAGFIVDRRAEAEAGVRLQPLGKVVSPEVVLLPEVLRLCEAVAARYAGTVSDVVRSAVPPRMARMEQEPRAEAPDAPGAGSGQSDAPEQSADPGPFAEYDGGAAFIASLAAGGSPRAVASVLPNQPGGWPALLTAAVRACIASGRGAVVVVPDARDLHRLTDALDAEFGGGAYARLSAEDGATPRYRNFLRASRGEVSIAVGTRSAAFAPVRDAGLLVLWEDHDSSHAEPRAPYHHARDTLLLRAEQLGCAFLAAGHGRSAEAQRLVLTRWATELAAPRAVLRHAAPRVVASSDSHEQERDPLLHAARLPRVAWKAAADALASGPVLVQVARTGFVPALRCETCRESARCTACSGPLGFRDARSAPSCRWCGEQAPAWICPECGGRKLRASTIGADRTAEELGRAFPQAPVISATGAQPRERVGSSPAVVVATPGAEPVADGGYAAVLLLDGDRMLARDGLRTAEDVLHRWMAAAALARPASAGGTVVVAASTSDPVRALVRWDPAAFAERELAERRELGLPPAVRSAVVSGPAAAADRFVGGLELPESVRLTGPVIEAEGEHRWLAFFPYAEGAAVAAELRRRKATSSAQRDPVVNVRMDPEGLL